MTLLKQDSNFPVPSEPNLTDRVAEMLVAEITGGNYTVGEVLPPEKAIAERLGVSRTVLREAVSRLKVDGLLSSKPGRGLAITAVKRPSVFRMYAASEGDLDHILRIVELRQGFEIEAAALAAQRRTESDLVAMRVKLVSMARAVANDDIQAGIDADFQFHQAIAISTRNDHYREFFDFLSSLLVRNLQVSRTRSARAADRGADAQCEHEILFNANERGDPELARQCARNHVENTEMRLRRNSAPWSNYLKRHA